MNILHLREKIYIGTACGACDKYEVCRRYHSNICQIVTRGAISNRLLLIDDNAADVNEVGHDEEKVETKDGAPPKLKIP